MTRKITIIKIRRTDEGNVNDNLQWLGNSLGLFNLRDKNSSCFRVFITLVKLSKSHRYLTSDEIAEMLHLTRGTVVHHLNNLINTGVVVKERPGYILRETNIWRLINDLERDMENIFSELKEVAKEIDENLG